MDKLFFRGNRRLVTFFAGSLLLIVAALLCVSLLQSLFSTVVTNGVLPFPATVLFTVYGYSSFLVPVYLLCAAILLLIPGGTVRTALMLGGSVIPFFTAVAGERLIKNFALTLGSPKSVMFVSVGLVISTVLVMLVEYIAMLWFIDFLVPAQVSSPVMTFAEETVVADEVAAVSVDESEMVLSCGSADVSDMMESPSSPEEGILPDAAVSAAEPLIGTNDVSSEEETWIRESGGASESGVPTPDGTDSVPLMNTTLAAMTAAAATAISAFGNPDREIPETSPDEGVFASGEKLIESVETPTYVDFEKMRAPFDLPVIDDWVEPEERPEHASAPGDMDEPDIQDESIEQDEPADQHESGDSAGTVDLAADAGFDADSIDIPVENWSVGDEISDGISDIAESETDGVDAEIVDADDLVPGNDEFIDIGEIAEEEALDDIPDDIADEITGAPSAEGELPPVLTVPPAPRESASGDEPEKAIGLLAAAAQALPFVKKNRSRNYAVPYDILTSYPDGEYWVIDDSTRRSAVALKETLNEFRIQADVTGIRKGPVITMFEILPAPGVKLSKIVGLQDNIALRLAASSVRIVAPIPGKHAVGIEVPNQKRAIVSFRELIEGDIPSAKKMEIPVVLGKDITGEAQLLDLASTPHLLIAGSTGSGKSVCVNSIILSILYKRSPEDVKLILIDPKIVELKLYNDIGHLLAPVITEPKKAFQALQYCLCEMERRYALLDGMGVRDIKSYNRRIRERDIATEKLPYIVIIIDEFADLMATTGKELESTVARLCAMSRAVGIHLVLATQRPSIDVITGLIKANIPTRIAFMVASKMDSRIIIDQVGAEKLLGKGDMLYASATDPFPVRIQGAFVSEEEVERVVEHVKTLGEPEYIDEEIFVEDDDEAVIDQSLFSDGEDPLYDKALEIVLLAGKASASYIQRKLKIGYNRAARLVEDMEARGIVGPANGSKPRDVIHHV